MAEGSSAGTNVVKNVTEMVDAFTQVATNDPLSGVLLAIGALLTGLSVAVLGYLSLGALIDLVTPAPGGGRPPQA